MARSYHASHYVVGDICWSRRTGDKVDITEVLGGVPMSLYLVERVLPGITMQQLGAFVAEITAASRRLTAEGTGVCSLRTTFLPRPSRCLCLLAAASAPLVKEVNHSVQFPYIRILNVLELAPEDGIDLSQFSSSPTTRTETHPA